jgi:hypothetical protein
MKNAFAPALLVLAFTILSTAQTQTAEPLSVAAEQVQRVEILYVPERIFVRAALSPERLELGYQYKLEIRDVRDSAEWQRLLSLLRETSVKPSGHSYDHRTAVLLFDKDGRRIASLYFDQFGTGGTINGKSGTISGGIYPWAKSLLQGVAEARSTMRLVLAAATSTAIPILVVLAYFSWTRVRRELTSWRNGAGLASMFIVFALWVIQATRWAVMSSNREFAGFLGTDWREIETFLPAFYAYPALPLAFALKGVSRLQMLAAWFLLAVFYGAFCYT